MALIGYARCSTDKQDVAAQRTILRGLGVPDDLIYVDEGLTGTSRKRPCLDQALAAVRGGDALVVPKLDRLARSVPDARDIGDSLVARGVRLHDAGEHNVSELAELFSVSRPTVYRVLERGKTADTSAS